MSIIYPHKILNASNLEIIYNSGEENGSHVRKAYFQGHGLDAGFADATIKENISDSFSLNIEHAKFDKKLLTLQDYKEYLIKLSPQKRKAFRVITYYFRKNPGVTRPPISWTANVAKVGETTVKEMIKEAEEAGWISVDTFPYNPRTKKRPTNIYHIHPIIKDIPRRYEDPLFIEQEGKIKYISKAVITEKKNQKNILFVKNQPYKEELLSPGVIYNIKHVSLNTLKKCTGKKPAKKREISEPERKNLAIRYAFKEKKDFYEIENLFYSAKIKEIMESAGFSLAERLRISTFDDRVLDLAVRRLTTKLNTKFRKPIDDLRLYFWDLVWVAAEELKLNPIVWHFKMLIECAQAGGYQIPVRKIWNDVIEEEDIEIFPGVFVDQKLFKLIAVNKNPNDAKLNLAKVKESYDHKSGVADIVCVVSNVH